MTEQQLADIKTALNTIRSPQTDRQVFIDYYAGNHQLAFATEKFKTAFGRTLQGMRDNLCPIVVDAIADRMEVINFAGDGEKAVADEAWKLWQRELMELVSNEVHVEAVKTGAAYVIVWNVDGKAKFYLQDSRNCAVIEDQDTGVPIFAAKQWETPEKLIRLNLYYPDRIEKWISTRKRSGSFAIKADSFVEAEEHLTPNPYGVIPMFKFETNPVLADAIPLQDALNKTFADRLVVQEFASFRQRWATGLEPPTDSLTGLQKKLFEGGIDKLWFTNSKEVSFGDFEVSPLEPFLQAAESDRVEMARVTGIPPYYFGINTSDAMSGKALKVLESRFIKKVRRGQLNFGVTWAGAMSLALQIEGQGGGNLTVQWEPAETRDEVEILDALERKRDTLDIPVNTLREEYGYTAEDIKKFDKEQDDTPPVDPAVLEARKMTNGG